jgi:hypothetical protein
MFQPNISLVKSNRPTDIGDGDLRLTQARADVATRRLLNRALSNMPASKTDVAHLTRFSCGAMFHAGGF